MISYDHFLEKKEVSHEAAGFDPGPMPDYLSPFQQAIVKWSCELATTGVFAGTGLGKTRMEIAKAQAVLEHTGKPYLILCPLAVAGQTVEEGRNVGVEIVRISEGSPTQTKIHICNYDRFQNLDLSAFAGVGCDESSILKSYTGATKQALVDSFASYRFKDGFTATPAPNDHMELGNHSEFLGIMRSTEMLMRWFINDTAKVGHYRLKGHAEEAFWRWMSSWACCIEKPSDIGFDDTGYILPKLDILRHIVQSVPRNSEQLISDAALSATTMHAEMRNTAHDRALKVAELVSSEPDKQWLIWCNTDYEADELKALIPDGVEVRGSGMSAETKEDRLLGFAHGSIQKLITKPSIAGMGLNYQSCNRMAFVGLSYSFEQMYQAIRRCWRFGQSEEVQAHIVTADSEWSVLESVERKRELHESLTRKMVESIQKTGLGLANRLTLRNEAGTKVLQGQDWKILVGDAVERIKEIDSDSVGLSVYSPPFSNLYTYSDSLRDMGNTVDHEGFFEHYGYLLDELLRITIPGRLVAIHCKDLPTYRGRDGASGLYDFPGELIKCHEAHGWSFHSRVTIWKCPVTERERTNNNGLLHKTVKRDSSQIRQGMADYVIVLRKTPLESNLSLEPITREEGFDRFVGDPELDPRTYHQHPSPYARLGGNNPNLAIWRRYAEPVWWDIDQTDVLNVAAARAAKDEKHICPLQLGLIRRCIQLWSNPNDLIFSPFGGLGSEGVVALQEGRRALLCELKDEYAAAAEKNLKSAKEQVQPSFFDMEVAPTQLEERRDDKATVFLQEIEAVSRKHGVTLSHEDNQGAFIVEPYSDKNIQWLKDARTNEGARFTPQPKEYREPR